VDTNCFYAFFYRILGMSVFTVCKSLLSECLKESVVNLMCLFFVDAELNIISNSDHEFDSSTWPAYC